MFVKVWLSKVSSIKEENNKKRHLFFFFQSLERPATLQLKDGDFNEQRQD